MRAAFHLALSVAALAGMTIAEAGAQTPNSVLKVVPQGDLKVLDPVWTTGTITQNHAGMVFDQLFSLDGNFETRPQMVDTWQVSPDGLAYTFKLRPGLAFHDGDPVRAIDAAESLKRWGQKDIMAQRLFQSVASVTADNDTTLRITLKEPYGLVLQTIGRVGGLVPYIMKERYAKTDPATQVTDMIGSGPFLFKKEKWVPGSKVVYVKNPNYKPRPEPASGFGGGKVVKVDRVEWMYIPDPATVSAALEAGEIDFWEVPPSDFTTILKRNPRIVLFVGDPLGTRGVLRTNFLHPPFDNPKARQALLWLTVQEDYMRAAVGNDPKEWTICGAMFTCDSPNATEIASEALMEKDRAKKQANAKRLLAEAGYRGEPIFILQATDDPQFNAAALVFADALKQIGANPQLVPIDWNTVLTRRASKKPPNDGGWHVFFTSGTGFGSSDPFANPSSTACEKAWFGWPCDTEIEKLRDAWTREPDAKKQRQLIEQLQAKMYEFVPYISWGQWTSPMAFRSNVKGVLASPQRMFWNIYKE
jgi:peptide/nickel transport system substrate-binding protein